jgi:hypothetical protein
MTPFEGGEVVGFNAGERCIEHFPSRHDDDVEPCCDLVPPEYLAGEALGPVTFDGRPELSGCGDSQTGCGAAVGHDEEHHVSAVNPDARFIGTFELRPATNPIGAPEALRFHED